MRLRSLKLCRLTILPVASVVALKDATPGLWLGPGSALPTRSRLIKFTSHPFFIYFYYCWTGMKWTQPKLLVSLF
ncbi:hypothetical protein F5X97DRAFT_303734 [Nemania serpens]|nr:hypothetical protein F5X97DRAFT_303734 [Nemania serpens]